MTVTSGALYSDGGITPERTMFRFSHGMLSCLQQYFENRLKFLATQKESGTNPYPHKFEANLTIPEYVKKYESLNSGDHLEDVEERIAGTGDCSDLCILT